MSRDMREAQIEALYGSPNEIVIARERGGRKSDKDAMLRRRQTKNTGYRNDEMAMLPKRRQEYAGQLKADNPEHPDGGRLGTNSPTDAPAVLGRRLDEPFPDRAGWDHENRSRGWRQDLENPAAARYDSVGNTLNVRTTRPARRQTLGGYQGGSLPSLDELQRQLRGQMRATRRKLSARAAKPARELQAGTMADPLAAAEGQMEALNRMRTDGALTGQLPTEADFAAVQGPPFVTAPEAPGMMSFLREAAAIFPPDLDVPKRKAPKPKIREDIEPMLEAIQKRLKEHAKFEKAFGYQEGSLDPAQFTHTPAVSPEVPRGFFAGPAFEGVADVLGPMGSQIRYGMSPEEKMEFEAAGGVPGVGPETMGEDPTGAMRATSAFLGGRKWGGLPAQAFQGARNLTKFYGALLSGDPLFGWSAKGEEAPGWDMRMDEIVREFSELGEAESGAGGRRGSRGLTRRPPAQTSIRG